MQKSCKSLLRLVALALIVIWCLPALALAKTKQPELPQPPVKITLLATARMNGHIIDWNYKLPRTGDFGLVKVSTLIKEQRQSNPYTILVDGGNMLSGSPLTDYFATTPSKLPNPMISMYNYLVYDAVVLGEGELAYGSDYLAKVLPLARFPLLSANAHTPDKALSAIAPYTIKEINVGKDKKKEVIRIGIIGATSVSPAAEYANLKFTDPTAATEAVIKKIGNKVDAFIIIDNNGLHVSGITAATYGKADIVAATPGKFGSSISKTDLTFEKIGKKWFLRNTDTNNVYAVTAKADKAMSDAAWPYHDVTLQHLAATEKPVEKPKL